MAYSDKVWKDSPDHTTPLSAAGLNDWEARIKAETDALEVLAAGKAGLADTNRFTGPTNTFDNELRVGTTDDLYPIDLYHSETDRVGPRLVHVHMRGNVAPSSAPSAAIDYHGLDLLVESTSANLNNYVGLYALEANAQHNGTGSTDRIIAGYLYTNNLGNANVNTDMTNLQMLGRNRGSGTVAAMRGTYFRTPVNDGGGTITNLYAHYIESVAGISGVTNAWAIYAAGGQSFHSGKFGFGPNESAPAETVAIRPQASNTVGLKVRGQTGQTEDLARFTDTSNNALLRILATGNINLNQSDASAISSTTAVAVQPTAGNIGLILKQTTTPTVDLAQFKDASGNSLIRILKEVTLNVNTNDASAVAGAGTGIAVQVGTDAVGLVVKSTASKTVDNFQVRDSSGNPTTAVNKDGYFTTWKTSAPADADLTAGQIAFWFDPTNGAAKMMFKAKETGGTVRTGSVALA